MHPWKSRLRSWIVPVPALGLGRYLRALLHDVSRIGSAGDGELLPPTRLIFDGSQSAEDFRRDGAEFLRYFVELGGLRPSDRVLEVGCAIGRKAIPLTRHLDARGSYDGFDIVRVGIDWCHRNVTPRFPRFRFAHADVFNAFYNPDGRIRAAEYRFPYADASFDFAFATSVFTHMLPDELDRYAGELSRVLAPGARCLASFLLLDDEAELCIANGKSMLTVAHPLGACRVESVEVPEAAVAYRVEVVRATFAAHGLTIVEPIHFGSWSGRSGGLSTQDILVAEKR
jgi:SAM-dependent methyltransferase